MAEGIAEGEGVVVDLRSGRAREIETAGGRIGAVVCG